MADDRKDDATWTERDRPASLSKRFIFASYSENREFLDRVAALSEETGIHPDISFGRDYANLTVNAMEGETLSDAERAFAKTVDSLVEAAN